MLQRRQILLKHACVCAMLVALCFIGPSLSARRHNARHEQHLPGVSIASSDKTYTLTAKQSTVSAETLPGGDYEQELNVVGPAAKFIAGTIANTVNFGLYLPAANFEAKTLIQFSRLTLPGYYAFLFRYALF